MKWNDKLKWSTIEKHCGNCKHLCGVDVHGDVDCKEYPLKHGMDACAKWTGK